MRQVYRRRTNLGPEGKPWARLYVDFVVDDVTKRSRPRNIEVKDIKVAALRFVAFDPVQKHGEASFRLGDFFRRLNAMRSQLEQDIVREAMEVNLNVGWLHGELSSGELSFDERLRVLRNDHDIRVRNGEIAVSDVGDGEKEKMLSLSLAAEYAGVSVDDLKDLERKGLLVVKRTNGGRRRYSVNQLEDVKSLLKTARVHKRNRSNLKMIGPIQRSATVIYAAEPMAAMGMPIANNGKLLTPKERRHLTVITVAQLYLEALVKFPEREISVIEYIRSKMEWLSASEITTYVRQARHRSDIPLPIFRQGRIRARRRTNPAVPEPAEIPEPMKEPAPKPQREPIRPGKPSRNPVTRPVPEKEAGSRERAGSRGAPEEGPVPIRPTVPAPASSALQRP